MKENKIQKRTTAKNSCTKNVKEKEKREYHEIKKQEPENTTWDDFSDSCFSRSLCSAQECTGLIPALPSSEAELEAYEEMYQFCYARPAGTKTETK